MAEAMDDGIINQGFSEGFCEDELWNWNKTWYAESPDFTACFHATVLVWVPCAFLWATLPIQAYHVLNRPYRVRRWTWNSVVKILLSLCLTILAVANMISIAVYWSNDAWPDPSTADLLASIIKTATFLLSAIYIFLDKTKARSSSGVLFIFWLLMLITSIATLRSNLMYFVEKDIHRNTALFTTQAISFVIFLVQFILTFFGERFRELDSNDKNPCPEKNASFFSEITFSWFNSMAFLGWKRPLTGGDLWTLLPQDQTKTQVDVLEKNWNTEMERKHRSLKESRESDKKPYQPSLMKALVKSYWLPTFCSGVLRLINDLSMFVTPLVLRLLLGFLSSDQPAWRGYMYAVIMLVSGCLQTLILNGSTHIGFRLGMQIRGSMVAIIYRKALRISSFARRSTSAGEIVNLMSVDAQRFMDLMVFIHLIWSAPLLMALSMYFLYDLMGWAVFVGLVTMVVTFMANAFIVIKVRGLQMQQMKEKDGRMKMMSEILNGMKVLKLYAWEGSFEKQVTDVRERELSTLGRAARLNAVSAMSWSLAPFLVALATFATYVLASEENILSPNTIFVAVSLLNILRMPLNMLPPAITMTIQTAIAVKRLTKFLQHEELDPNNVQELPASEPDAIKVKNSAFSWGGDDPVILKDINIDIKEGQLVAVVGQVGSGKSSLCSALMGLMDKKAGQVGVKGSVAYVPQQAWIQNLSLQDNILYGKTMKRDRYEQTLDVCSLRTDLEMLAGGDQTEIGERGTNLSGGQRQRVSLARAVFSDSDVYILDDPLSAVDAHVGKHIFDKVIGPAGVLRNKTRILVTHGIGYLPQTDLIIVLANGTISEVGTYRKLLQNRGAFSDFLRTYLTEDPDAIDEEDEDPEAAAIKDEILHELNADKKQAHRGSIVSLISNHDGLTRSVSRVSNASLRKVNQLFRRESRKNSRKPSSSEEKEDIKKAPGKDTKGQLVETERVETGGVKWSVYLMLAKHMSYVGTFALAGFYAASFGFSMGSTFWLNGWASDSLTPGLAKSNQSYRLGIYGMFGALQGLGAFAAAMTIAFTRVRASRQAHEGLLYRIIRAPMAFFDTTPLGRIVNRFSKDVDALDTLIPQTIEIWLMCFYSVVSSLFVVAYNIPPFIAVLVPLLIFFYFMQRFYVATSRQLKRLESTSRSPIYSHFQESISGSSVIAATRQIDRFVRDNERQIDVNNASYYPNIISQRWIAIRLESVAVLVTFCAAMFAVIGREFPSLGIDLGGIGMSISYSMSVGMTLNFLVRTISDMESNVVSVERIKEYTEIETEAEWVNERKRPPANWPTEGRVNFDNYKTKYRPDLDLVLKGVDTQIKSGEKIGIVGRTGAGKSSLTLALFRIIEAVEGSIKIDDLNIADLGLHDVRSRITILPQEPVLFSGTLRLNLDPFGKFSDQEVWLALENAHLKKFVSSLPEGLNHMVADSGDNYSVGQRQLICLARALLRKTKILVLDEATAAIDLETDDLIQATIRDKFADCTVLTIAHRINTIMDSTRIMVLDQGKVKEFDTPANLLSDTSGIFYSLAKAANVLPNSVTITVN